MSRITVNDLRALVETNLTDTQLDSIISIANKQINSVVGSATDDKLFLAELYLSAALLLRRLKTNGELPDSLKVGEVSQNVKIDEMISYYEEEAKKLIKQYQVAANFKTLYTTAGIDWSDKELPGDY